MRISSALKAIIHFLWIVVTQNKLFKLIIYVKLMVKLLGKNKRFKLNQNNLPQH